MRRLLAAIGALSMLFPLVVDPATATVHWVNRMDTPQWNSLATDMILTPGSTTRIGGTAATPPDGVADAKYARILNATSYATSADLAWAVINILDANPNAFVAINEIGETVTNNMIADAASQIYNAAPLNNKSKYNNRWGVFLSYRSGAIGPDYSNIIHATAIEAVYNANGRLLPEVYPRYSVYWTCNNAATPCTTDAARDNWLNATFFTGPGKISWLASARTTGSVSIINPIFGIGNTYLNSTNETSNLRFMDRVFYVFMTKFPYPGLAKAANGGIGSYLWSGTDNVQGQGTVTTRDQTFSLLWKRYATIAASANPASATPNWSGNMPAPTTGTPPPAAAGWKTFDGPFASEPIASGGPIQGSAAMTTWGSGTLDVFARGPDNQLYQKQYRNSTWTGWIPLGGTLTSSPAAVAWAPGRIDIFARGGNNDLIHKYYNGAIWSGWESFGGSIVGAPTVTTWGPGTLDVFARGSDNALWQLQYRNAWTGWIPSGGVLASSPGAVAWGPGRIDIFAKGTDGTLIQKYYDGVAWSGWASLGGAITSAPAVTTWGPGTLDVFARGANTTLVHLQYRSGWSGWIGHGREIVDAPSAVAWGSGRIDIILPAGGNVPYWYYYS